LNLRKNFPAKANRSERNARRIAKLAKMTRAAAAGKAALLATRSIVCLPRRFRYEESAMLTLDFLVTDPEHWRARAESIRVTASLLNDADAKARMLRIAEGYEGLGKQTEHRRRTGW
jgi:hypothetical protein